MTRHGTPPATPGLSPACFTHLSPLLVFGKPFAWWESRKLAYSPVTLAVVFRVGLFSFLSAKLGPVWPKPAPDRAGTGRSPTWGENWAHGASWGAKQGGLGGSVGTALGQLCFDSSAVRSATRIGESRRAPVFRVTCVTGGKGSSVFCEGGTVSLPQIQDRKAATCLKVRC